MNRENQIEEKGALSALVLLLVNAAGLFLAAQFIPGVVCKYAYSIPIAAVLLVLASWIIEPFLYLLTLPINLATFGLFTVVTNGIVLAIVGMAPHGFSFQGRFWGLGPAILTSLLVSALRLVARMGLVRMRKRRNPRW